MQPIARTDVASRIHVRVQQAPVALRVLSRVTALPPIILSAALAMLIVTFMKQSDQGYDMPTATRLTAVFIAAGAAMLLDDPAANLTGHSPAPLSFRRSLRLLLGCSVIVLVWLGSLWYVTGTPRALWAGSVAGTAFPTGRFTIELLAFILIALTIAIVAGERAGEDRGGVAGAPGLLAVILLLSQLPPRWQMLVGPESDRWVEAGRAWTLAVCALLLTLMALSRDPARRILARSASRERRPA